MKTIHFRLASFVVLLIGVQFPSLSIAQGGPGGQPPETIYRSTWNDKIKPDTGLKAHDDSLLGDRIDLSSGQLSFEQVDVSIPGNSDLPVEIRRKRHTGPAFKYDFNDWQIAVPMISTKIMANEFNQGIRWGKNRCTNSLISSIPISKYGKVIDPIYGQWVYPQNYSSGVNLDVPGKSSARLLDKSVQASWPSNASKVTVDGWYFTCIPNIDGAGTEGFMGFAPNGDKYRFDVIRSYNAVTPTEIWVIKGIGTPFSVYGNDWTHYDVLAASEVTDVHGNKVNYSYDSLGRLTSISSNDGRQINLNYPSSSSKLISSVVANPGTVDQRTWNYNYGSVAVNLYLPPSQPMGAPTSGWASRPALTTVVLPDGRSWQYQLGGMFAPSVAGTGYTAFSGQSVQCSQISQTISVTHPDGILGQFTLQETKRYIPFSAASQWGPPCPNTAAGRDSPTYSDVMAVINKTLSSASTPTATWNYSYLNADNGMINRTVINAPDGSKTINHYWPAYNATIMKQEIFADSTTTVPVQTTVYNYQQETDAGFNFVQGSSSEVFKPLRQTEIQITRSSDSYNTQYSYITDRNATNYSYGYPVTTNAWSSLGNGTRTTNVTYLKDADDWILGLPDTVIKNGKLFDDYDWDDKGRLTTHKQFGTTAGTGVTVATLGYHTSGTQSGQLNWYRDALNRQTIFNDYYRGTPRSITRADNTQVSYQIDENGWVKGITNARGYTTNYQYNPIGRLTLIDLPSPWNDTSVSYTYSGGNLLQTVTKGMERITNTFDAMLRPTKVVREDLGGSLASIQSIKNYDAMGREIFASLPGIGAPSAYGKLTAYDTFGRVTSMQETAPGGGTTNYTYLAGNKVRVTDPLGNSVTTTSSGYGNPGDGKTLKVEKPAGITTDFTYNIYGNLLTIAQAKGDGTNHFSSYIYDDRLRVCRVKIPEKGDSLFQYNDANEKIAYAEGLASDTSCPVPSGSARVTQNYDALSRPLLTDFADATPDINRGYDANGNVTSVNRNGVNWAYTYNPIDLVQTETLSLDGRTYGITNSYDNDGTLNGKTYPSGQYYAYFNDNFGRVNRINANSINYLSNIAYHANGKINTLARGNGGSYEQRLNDRQLTSFIGGNWGDSQYYYYNANAQVTQIDAVNYNVYDRSFGYDGAGRLTSATGPWGTGAYIYDTLNNIIHKREGSRVVEVAYNSLNQASHARDLDISPYWNAYSHDSRGNVINNGKFNFTYDLSNQPVSMSGSVNSSFTYDGNLRRVKQIVNGETIYSIYDKSGAVLTQDNVTTNTKTDYVTVAGQTFVRIKNGIAYYPLNDHLGTAFMEADQNGSVASNKTFNYTPFGENSNALPFGSAGNDPGNNTEQGFTGHIEDKSGLVYMQARYYDPVIGRFLSTDPIGYEDGLNVYAYVGNDPINAIDPDGQLKISLGFELTAVVVAGVKVGASVYVDTNNLEMGASISGGPRFGLEGGGSVGVSLSESSNAPAKSDSFNNVTVDASVGALAVSGSHEILSENGGVNKITEGNSVSANMGLTKIGTEVGGSIGVNFSGTTTTDALVDAKETIHTAAKANAQEAAKVANTIDKMRYFQ